MDFQITPIADIQTTARMAVEAGLPVTANPHGADTPEYEKWRMAYSSHAADLQSELA